MATRATYPPFDVAATSTALAAGRQVRVGILPTHHFPEGGAGRVRAVGDPGLTGPEFVDVEVVIGGVKDVIPFAPADLTPIKRGQRAPVALASTRPSTSRSARPASTRLPRTGKAAGAAAADGIVAAAAVPAADAVISDADAVISDAGAAISDAGAVGAEPARRTTATPSTDAAPAAAPDSAAARKPRPRGRPARTTPTAVLITVGTVEPDHEQWQAHVAVDGKPVGRPGPVSPAQVWSLIGQLGVPAAERAVGQALSVHRERARLRAEQLAKELAAAEAELARYPAAD